MMKKKVWKNFDEERAGAREKALVLLTDMDRTESGLRERLLRSGFSLEAAQDAVEYVRGCGYLDDERYARHYVEVMQGTRSRRRMEYDMTKKGLSRELIEAAMESAGPRDERPLIRSLAEKKARHLDLSDPKSRMKLAAYLGRQGFQSADILSVLDEMRTADA